MKEILSLNKKFLLDSKFFKALSKISLVSFVKSSLTNSTFASVSVSVSSTFCFSPFSGFTTFKTLVFELLPSIFCSPSFSVSDIIAFKTLVFASFSEALQKEVIPKQLLSTKILKTDKRFIKNPLTFLL